MLVSAILHERPDEVISVVHQAEPWTSEVSRLVTLPTKRNRTAGGGGNDEDMQFRMSLCLLD